MSNAIPLSVPVLNGHEWKFVKRCFDTGWISSVGPFVDGCEDDIRKQFKVKHAVACVNGTSALHVALHVAGVTLNDEVIAPTITFIAPINAIRYTGAHPVFMDCDRFYNMDMSKTLEFLKGQTFFKDGVTYNKKTRRKIKAIVPVHVFGNALNLEPLLKVTQKLNIKVIEDATESIGTVYTSGKLKNKFSGSVGDMGCFSFNGNKIISGGGGGMIVTNNAEYAQQARYLTTQARDEATWFVHDNVGYNYRLNSIQASLISAQLKILKNYIKIKKNNYLKYKKEIDGIGGLKLASVPSYAQNNYWMYALQVDHYQYGRSIDDLIAFFKREQIEVRPLWYPNHLQRPYRYCETYKIESAIQLHRSTINLPCSVNLKDKDISRIGKLLRSWKK